MTNQPIIIDTRLETIASRELLEDEKLLWGSKESKVFLLKYVLLLLVVVLVCSWIVVWLTLKDATIYTYILVSASMFLTFLIVSFFSLRDYEGGAWVITNKRALLLSLKDQGKVAIVIPLDDLSKVHLTTGVTGRDRITLKFSQRLKIVIPSKDGPQTTTLRKKTYVIEHVENPDIAVSVLTDIASRNNIVELE